MVSYRSPKPLVWVRFPAPLPTTFSIGWISKDSVPDNLKPLSVPPFSQNSTPASTIKNNKGGFNLSITKSELLNFIYLLALVLVLIIIFVFRKKIGTILKHKKSTSVYREVEVRKKVTIAK